MWRAGAEDEADMTLVSPPIVPLVLVGGRSNFVTRLRKERLGRNTPSERFRAERSEEDRLAISAGDRHDAFDFAVGVHRQERRQIGTGPPSRVDRAPTRSAFAPGFRGLRPPARMMSASARSRGAESEATQSGPDCQGFVPCSIIVRPLCGVFGAEGNRYSPALFVEHGDQLKASAQCFDVLPQR
jgi:hypothetical protein